MGTITTIRKSRSQPVDVKGRQSGFWKLLSWQGGAPPVIGWFITLVSIDISTINHSYWSYLHQLSQLWGTTSYTWNGWKWDTNQQALGKDWMFFRGQTRWWLAVEWTNFEWETEKLKIVWQSHSQWNVSYKLVDLSPEITRSWQLSGNITNSYWKKTLFNS